MNSIELISKVRGLAEEAQQNKLLDEARTLFGTELVLTQMAHNKGENPPPWANKPEIQAFITNRVIHAQPQAI